MRAELWTTAALAIVLTGCGGGGGGGAAPPPASGGPPPAAGGSGGGTGAAKKAWSADQGTATVSGMVKFQGEAPKRRPVDMGREKSCHEHHGSDFLDESVIVGADGGVQNVFVYVSKGAEGWSFTAPSAPVMLDQQHCVYQPHVVGVQVGQMLKVSNSDDFMHNVHGFPKKNEDFNFSQGGGAAKEVTFTKAEVPLPLKCDVHGWMGAFACVVDHPFFAVTGADGKFTLPKLAPGTYTITTWHEVYGTKEQQVTVAASDTKRLEFQYSEDDE